MRVVRGREEARWLPSRHHFALFRLAAYLRLRTAKPSPVRDDLVLAIDRGQSAFENYGIAIWVVLTITCYFAGDVFERWPLAAAIAVSLVLAMITTFIPLCIVGSVRRGNNIRLNSVIAMTLLIAAALYYATATSWLRFVAWQFLALVALNALAAVIVLLLRPSIARLEATFEA